MALWGRRPYQVLVELHVTRALDCSGVRGRCFPAHWPDRGARHVDDRNCTETLTSCQPLARGEWFIQGLLSKQMNRAAVLTADQVLRSLVRENLRTSIF